MQVGELSRTTGVSTRLLRYYEQQGLLVATRSPNGYRDFPTEAVDVVGQVRQMLLTGLPTAVIRDLLPCTGPAGVDTRACPQLLARIAAVRDDVRARAEQAARAAAALSRFLRSAEAQAGPAGPARQG